MIKIQDGWQRGTRRRGRSPASARVAPPRRRHVLARGGVHAPDRGRPASALRGTTDTLLDSVTPPPTARASRSWAPGAALPGPWCRGRPAAAPAPTPLWPGPPGPSLTQFSLARRRAAAQVGRSRRVAQSGSSHWQPQWAGPARVGGRCGNRHLAECSAIPSRSVKFLRLQRTAVETAVLYSLGAQADRPPASESLTRRDSDRGTSEKNTEHSNVRV